MAGTVKVKVRDGWAVYDGTTQRGGGHALEVDPETAERWERAGWVERVKTNTERVKTTTSKRAK